MRSPRSRAEFLRNTPPPTSIPDSGRSPTSSARRPRKTCSTVFFRPSASGNERLDDVRRDRRGRRPRRLRSGPRGGAHGAEDLVEDGGRVAGVVTGSGARLHARAVVVTTGTFLRGLMHTGERRTEGGRVGEPAAVGLSAALARTGLALGRFKTGTPPRVAR